MGGDVQAIDDVSARLEDMHGRVRLEAARALGAVGRGDDRAITAVVKRLQHAEAQIRDAAVEAMEKVADKGDVRAIAAMRPPLAHADQGVVEAVQAALLQVNPDCDAIEEPRLLDRDHQRRLLTASRVRLMTDAAVRSRQLSDASDDDALDSDFGLSEEQLLVLASCHDARERALTTASVCRSACESGFGLSDEQLAALMSGQI